eukprot:GHVS01050881.1.p1 GENE.GHVS01050881.1~~GHVS01050881.1.p1  ORF type:complete len:212 (-),score=36.78 GHVS01050881.1:293-928(-)
MPILLSEAIQTNLPQQQQHESTSPPQPTGNIPSTTTSSTTTGSSSRQKWFSCEDEYKQKARRWLDEKTIESMTNKRNPYIEIREYSWVEEKERKAVRHLVGKEIRDKCRPEFDEYHDCVQGCFMSVSKCEPMYDDVKRCLNQYQNNQQLLIREAEMISQREHSGTGLLKMKQRAKYNRFIDNPEVSHGGWLPRSQAASSCTEEQAMNSKFV